VIVRKTWREVRMMALAYALILELLLVPAVLLWPSLRDEGALSTMQRLMPADFLARMFENMTGGDNAAYRAYMAVQMFFKGVNIVGIAGAVLLGTGMIARERENQTLEFLLARPVGRARILWSKFWVVALVLVVPVFLTSWSAVPLSLLIGEELPFGVVTLASLHSSVFVLSFLALTCLVSVRVRTQVHVAFVVGAVVILQVAAFFIQKVRVASVFRLSDFEVYGPILAGNVPWAQVLREQTVWPLLVAAACYGIAHRTFRRADL
jgi:ABC-2 type transport system permease protein